MRAQRWDNWSRGTAMAAIDARGRLLPGLIVALAALWISVPLVGGDSAALSRAVAHAFAPAPAAARMPVGLREAASAAAGADQTAFHVRQRGAALVATGGGLATRFDAGGVHVTAGGAGVTFALAAAATAPTAARNRITYRRGDMTEWYVNGPAGLEQGFTLVKPHALSLTLSGTLAPRQRGQAIEFTRGVNGPVVLRYGGLSAFDARGRSLPARLELAGRTLWLRVDDRGARYPVTVDPLIQQGSKLTPSGATGSSQFGFSVALSSDGNTALVGGPTDNTNAGAAWVFTRSGATWTQQKTFIPGDAVGAASFGWSVALSADGHTALIGGPSDSGNQGAAWISSFDTGTQTWSSLAKLMPALQPVVGAAQFGYSVALSADGTVALIGGPQDRITLTANFAFGAVWAYVLSGGTWLEQEKITGSGEAGAGEFGTSVALSGASPTFALIGGPHDSSDAGAAWVYDNGDGWLFDAKLTPSDETGSGLFGASVALVGDGTKAPLTAVIGAPNDNGNAGAAWVFSGDGTGALSQVGSKLTAGDESGAGLFGSSVALAADGDTAVVGGSADAGAGAAWTFKPVGSSWVQAGPKLTPNDGNGPKFGSAAALSQDGSTAFIGGPTDNGNAGAAWPFAQGARTYTVTTTADSADDAVCQPSSCTLRQAVNAANFGLGTDTIVVPAGAYQLSGRFGALLISKGMTVTGAGARSTSILAAASERVFDLTSSANPVVIQGFTISGGTATANNGFFGGNIRSSGVLTLLEDTITNGNASSGGGVSNNAGTLLIERSTISGNSALDGGGDSGGVQNFGTAALGGTLTIRNSTISSNTARLGGGVFSWTDPGSPGNTTTVENSTISSNAATDRGLGGIGGSGTFTFKNTIVSSNTFGGAPSNCDQTMPSLGNNLESGADCGFTAAGDLQNTDPQLGALADNGGLTDTQAITSASAAFDAGSSDCPPPSTDQRGTTRPQGARCDIGAFELAVAAPPAGPPAAPAGTAPTIVGQAAPTIGAESATVSASINPNGSATTVVVQYGTTAAYGQQTAAVAIGAGTTLQIVNQNLTGLTPSTVYHFRFVATNGAGTTNGPDTTFTTAVPGGSSQQPPPGPAQGVSANVFPLVGTVVVNGQPLAVGQQIPLGSTIDATKGTVLIRAVINGVVQEMQFAGGIFQLLQLPNGTVQLVLTGGNFSVCKTTKAKKAKVKKAKKAKKKSARVTRSASRADNARTVRMLWGNGKGSFQTKGRYAAATVRGTIYQVADRCDGTFTRVRQGTVSVLDLVRNRTVSIAAGKSLLIKP